LGLITFGLENGATKTGINSLSGYMEIAATTGLANVNGFGDSCTVHRDFSHHPLQVGQPQKDSLYQNGQTGEVRPHQVGGVDQTTNGNADALEMTEYSVIL